MQALEELLNIGHSFSSSTYPSNEVYLLWEDAIDRFEAPEIKNSPNPHGQGSFYYLT